ncbi:uncharacterized protein LOC131882084 [Tigriopus californicus]|uniref:uncharacterized protein LOC131882084 n=1 Tax=Tigriopus californicus TaxID=6832 RepID=UPI0027DA085F|nr:uncharacterized protein LOC131882084 [Tigriopus californicus]
MLDVNEGCGKIAHHDPWSEDGQIQASPIDDIENKTNQFENDFVTVGKSQPSASISLEPLPDSAEYLAHLEAKLNRLQTPKGSLVQDLKARREDEMRRFLQDSQWTHANSEDSSQNQDIHINPILRRLAPERQALTIEEQVRLLAADQLDYCEQSDLTES